MIKYNDKRTHCKITFDKDSNHTLFNVDAIFFPISGLLVRRQDVDSIGTVHMQNGCFDFGHYGLLLKDIESIEFDTGTHIEKVTINLK